jgi:hypothetical protein
VQGSGDGELRMVALLDELCVGVCEPATVSRIVRCVEPLQRAAATRRSGLRAHLLEGALT